jgi:hypothetical protein
MFVINHYNIFVLKQYNMFVLSNEIYLRLSYIKYLCLYRETVVSLSCSQQSTYRAYPKPSESHPTIIACISEMS